MGKTRHDHIAGAVFQTSLRYDKLARMEAENYPDFRKNPVSRPDGYPLVLTYVPALTANRPKWGVRRLRFLPLPPLGVKRSAWRVQA